MALDRWIALAILIICLIYGYTAFFTMDGSLPPFMRRNPVWPSTFPKILAVLGVVTSLIIVLGLEKPAADPKPQDINYRRLGDYKVGQALLLLNEKEYLRAARNLARKTLSDLSLKGDAGRLTAAYETITSQLPDEEERGALLAALADLKEIYSGKPALAAAVCEGAASPELAAWTLLVSSIQNLDITKTRQ